MAGSVSVNPNEYQDLVIAFLLDMLIHGNPTDNKEFDFVLERMKTAGLRGNLLTSFLQMPGQSRVLYKIIRPVLFKEQAATSRITIDSRT